MLNILVLGHRGMLGNAVVRFFSKKSNIEVTTTELRWGTENFKKYLTESNSDYIINCIGSIPQTNNDVSTYRTNNIDLPIFLETLGKRVIHPSTDCEFCGNIPFPQKYRKIDKRDASDDYGKSKAYVSELIESTFKNTKIIRTSIIGHELSAGKSLLDWFLKSEDSSVKGYTNHYWNGITTLEWVKLSARLIENWNILPTLNQYGTPEIESKFDLLNHIKTIYNKNIEIERFQTKDNVNKCLESDTEIPPINLQLRELKEFYSK